MRVSPEIEFKEGDKEHVVQVEVLFDGVREMREAFTLHLKPDENMVAETQVRNVFMPCLAVTQNPETVMEFKLNEKVKTWKTSFIFCDLTHIYPGQFLWEQGSLLQECPAALCCSWSRKNDENISQ